MKKRSLILLLSLPLLFGSCSVIKKIGGNDCNCPKWGQHTAPAGHGGVVVAAVSADKEVL